MAERRKPHVNNLITVYNTNANENTPMLLLVIEYTETVKYGRPLSLQHAIILMFIISLNI